MTASLEQLQPGQLPVFRRTGEMIAGFGKRRDQVTARELANEILADPLATLYMLHAINKRVGERSGAEVNTVEHALMMQGIGAFLDAASGWPILEDCPAGKDQRLLSAVHALTRRAQHAAWQARDFAVLHSDIRAEEVQVAAILHYAPELLLWLRMPEQALALRRKRRHVDTEAAEISVLGDSLDTIRLPLLESWNIPPLTLDLLGPRNADHARQRMLAACLEIACRSDAGWWDEQLLPCYENLAGVEHATLETVIATVHANSARVARCCNWLMTPPAACWVPMIPGPWPPEPEDEEETAHASVTQETSPTPATQSVPPLAAPAKQEAAAEACPMPDKNVFLEAMQGIEKHLDGSLTLNQMSAIILKGLHTGLGLSRIIFAMITPDGMRVRSRFTLGISAEDPLRHFEFELAGKDLFGQLMGKMQGVWLNEGNRQKLWPMIQPRLQAMLGEGDFYTMSLYNGVKPVGLIYADRGKGRDGHECGLDPLTYTDFKMLCLQAARGLGRIKPSV